MAKEFLAKTGIAFTVYDVTKDKAALEEMREISGGALRVPVIAICNEVMVGFDRERVEMAMRCLGHSTEV
ncbi:MAG: glutaredoxin family protein [Thermodesulfobacteriota bacterium]|nr:glutaredoxin family protein [Thermodesulfobacteriota bacterium]